jgi:hypothetical protein
MAPCTIGALALCPTGNAQGNYYFFSLSTGRIINRVHATWLQMPDDVIDHVHALACHQKADSGLLFLDRNRIPKAVDDADNDDDSDFVPDDEQSDYSDSDSDDDIDYDPDDDDALPNIDSVASASDHDSVSEDEFHPDGADGTPGVDSDGDDNNDDDNDDEDNEPAGNTGVAPTENPGVNAPPEDPGVDAHNHDEAELDHDMDARYGPRTGKYSLQQRKEHNYSRLFVNTNDDAPLATPQMSLKKGLKVFSEQGVAAVKKEMLQLHEHKVMEPKHSTELTPSQKKEALAYLMFLKWKHCGKIKGHGCANGPMGGVAWGVVVWYGVVWRGVAWRGVAWHGVAWRRVALCGVLWCGVM